MSAHTILLESMSSKMALHDLPLASKLTVSDISFRVRNTNE